MLQELLKLQYDTTLERNGQLLLVAFAKNIHGSGVTTSQSSRLAATAIEKLIFFFSLASIILL
jgi:hypothetical protein